MPNNDRRIVPHDQQVPVKVTFDDKSGNKIVYYMNFNNPVSVKKLVKSLHWALVNGHVVTMVEDTVENANAYWDTKHNHVESIIMTQNGEVRSDGTELLGSV